MLQYKLHENIFPFITCITKLECNDILRCIVIKMYYYKNYNLRISFIVFNNMNNYAKYAWIYPILLKYYTYYNVIE